MSKQSKAIAKFISACNIKCTCGEVLTVHDIVWCKGQYLLLLVSEESHKSPGSYGWYNGIYGYALYDSKLHTVLITSEDFDVLVNEAYAHFATEIDEFNKHLPHEYQIRIEDVQVE